MDKMKTLAELTAVVIPRIKNDPQTAGRDRIYAALAALKIAILEYEQPKEVKR